MRRCVLAILAAGCGGLMAADPPKPLDRAELDKRAYAVAFEAAMSGTKTYNAGDPGGCHKLYEGTLRALAAVLDHRPEVVKEITDRLADADKQTAVPDKAHTLRKALDAVMEQTSGKAPTKPVDPTKPADPPKDPVKPPMPPMPPKDPPKDPPMPAAKQLWERMGGDGVAKAVAKDFVAAVMDDKKLNFTRDGKLPLDATATAGLERTWVKLISGAAGGPFAAYPKEEVDAVYAARKITADEYKLMVDHLKAALDKQKVAKAEADELVKALTANPPKGVVEEKK